MSAPANESAASRLPGLTLVRMAALALGCASLCALSAGCQPWLVADSVTKSLPSAKTPAEADTSDRGSRADSVIATDASKQITTARPQSESTAQEYLLNEVATDEPHRVLRSETPNFWDCDLAVIQQIALTNVAIIRDRSQFLSPGNSLLTNPDLVASGFDPAIQEAGGPFNGTGVGQALGDFDPFFITRTVWGHNELLQNNRFLSGGLAPGMELSEDSAAFSARVEKTLSTGGVVSVGQEWDYNQNNVPARLYPSVYTGRLYGEFRQPLLAGAGSDFTSVAGPLWRNPTGNTLNQGVVIARLNTEMSMYDFENRVQALLKNLEDAWWDLALAYETYNAELESRENMRRIWENVKGRLNQVEGVDASDEAQARENYYEHCATTDDALTNVYQRESQLRRLVGMPVNDGRLIRPAGTLETDEKTPDWHQALAQALTQRVELRRQKANLRGLAAQRDAAHNLTRPRLDFISGYQLNGFGDDLFGMGSSNPPFPSAYSTQFSTNQTGWNLGLEFSMPIGFRAPQARQQNLELRLAKGNAALQAQELEISHELANAFQQADRWVAVAQSNIARRDAARQRVEALEAKERIVGQNVTDLLLRAQSSLMQAEVAVRRSFAEYRKALAELSFRTGSMLDRYSISMAETVRDPAAYAQALKVNLERVKRGGTNVRLETEPEFEVVTASSKEEVPGEPRKTAPPMMRSRSNAQP